jgi:hypothetical protein
MAIDTIVQFALGCFFPIRRILCPIPVLVLRVESSKLSHNIIAGELSVIVIALGYHCPTIGHLAGLVSDSDVNIYVDISIYVCPVRGY